MTEQEQKEVELFKEWWNIFRDICLYEYHRDTAEEAWLARAKLDKDKDETKDM